MPKIGFPMPTAKNRFHFRFLIYTPKNIYLKKHDLKGKNYQRTLKSYGTLPTNSEELTILPVRV